MILPDDQEGADYSSASPTAAAVEPQPRLILRASVESPQQLQAPIVQFVAGGAGGTGQQQLASFFQRLGATPADKLPAAVGRVRLLREWGETELRDRVLAAAAVMGKKAAAADGDKQQSKGQAAEELQIQDVVAGGGGSSSDDEQFLVLNALGGGAAREAALAAWKESSRKFLPWVGIAAPLGGLGENSHLGGGAIAATAGGGGTAIAGAAAGRAFCFLPLPVPTGLPVAVNGYFELSSNRRDVWHGEDMAGAGAARARWNAALLADALGPAYLQLLLAAAREMGPTPAFFALFPGQGAPEPWAAVPRSLYRLLGSQPLLHCPEPAPKGAWMAPGAAVLPDESALADGKLRGLMLAVGVPLALGLREAARECVLKWTPGASKVRLVAVSSTICLDVNRALQHSGQQLTQTLCHR